MTRGNKHCFLGMNISINERMSIVIDMKEQLVSVINLFNKVEEEKVTEVVSSPSRKHLKM